MRRAVKRLQAAKCLKQGLKKRNLEFQLILWAISSHILLVQGHLLLVLVNDFVIGSVADPDPEIRRAREDSKNFFSALWASV